MRTSYYLISVSNRVNLELCIKHALAGFMNNISGVWTFLEMREGDFVSFLYGAKAYNLYSIYRKEAFRDARTLPPWQPITFQQSGRTYDFPFRLYLKPIRKFEESLVRAEFAYVAENLLLRGGYRRTHFQADQTTLQAASQMGALWNNAINELDLSKYENFTPRFTRNRRLVYIPEVFIFHEFVLQALIKHHLSSDDAMGEFLYGIEMGNVSSQELEVLGEKAFPEGHVDILIKEATPKGLARKIIVEVKTGPAIKRDLIQLKKYADEIGQECIASILIARAFSPSIQRTATDSQIRLFTYSFKNLGDMTDTYTFNELLENLQLNLVQTKSW